MFGSSKSWGLNSTHLHGTHVPVQEPSTASKADMCGAKRHVRFGPKADIPAIVHYSIGCKRWCASEALETVFGVRSESGTLNLQTSPVEAKVASTFPLNCSSARKNSRVPKPRCFGMLTGGPSLSRHSRF